jgi:predicted house-cleaning noncanonical NTP pyrophosphatase (MazG superfamily)
MAPGNNILQELREMNSGLAGFSHESVFRVPEGYFDSLAGEILRKIKASEAANAKEELEFLSPMLSGFSKTAPYSVPAGYFQGLEKKLDEIILAGKEQSVTEELESLSPLLSGLKNKPTYTVPEGYFHQLERPKEDVVLVAKVVSITSRKWFRYAAAAILIGVVATIGFKLIKRGETIDPSDKSLAWVKKNMKKVSTDDINEFVELANTASADIVKTDTKDDITNLLKDVSDKEIQDFLNDTQTAETETEDELILN